MFCFPLSPFSCALPVIFRGHSVFLFFLPPSRELVLGVLNCFRYMTLTLISLRFLLRQGGRSCPLFLYFSCSKTYFSRCSDSNLFDYIYSRHSISDFVFMIATWKNRLLPPTNDRPNCSVVVSVSVELFTFTITETTLSCLDIYNLYGLWSQDIF